MLVVTIGFQSHGAQYFKCFQRISPQNLPYRLDHLEKGICNASRHPSVFSGPSSSILEFGLLKAPGSVPVLPELPSVIPTENSRVRVDTPGCGDHFENPSCNQQHRIHSKQPFAHPVLYPHQYRIPSGLDKHCMTVF